MADLVRATRFYIHEGNHYLLRDIEGADGKHLCCEAGRLKVGSNTVDWQECHEGSPFTGLQTLNLSPVE